MRNVGTVGGMIFGDLPPTEAFPIGGTNSVRGYAEGAVGSARHFATGHSEFRFPVSGPFEVGSFLDLKLRSQLSYQPSFRLITALLFRQ